MPLPREDSGMLDDDNGPFLGKNYGMSEADDGPFLGKNDGMSKDHNGCFQGKNESMFEDDNHGNSLRKSESTLKDGGNGPS